MESNIIKIIIYPKVYFIWVLEVGTSRGHEPIIDRSCGAIIFSPDRAHRDLSASDLWSYIMDLRPTYARNTGQLKITYIPQFKKSLIFKF